MMVAPGSLTIVDAGNVMEYPPRDGFEVPDLGLVRPAGFYDGNSGVPYLEVADMLGRLKPVELDDVPYMATFNQAGSGRPEGNLVTFRHRKGEQREREDLLRILRISSSRQDRYPPSGIYHGEHPDHPGQVGFYLLAQHVGRVGLNRRDATYLDPAEVQPKFFPIGAAAES